MYATSCLWKIYSGVFVAMSDSGGVNVSKAGLKGGMIAAIIFCSLCIGYGLLETAKYERQANDKSREYAKYTRDKVAEACVGIPRLEKVKCLNEAIDAQREYETNQQDLATQKTSALWACIMGAAAVFGMALSAVGVWLVKITFDETRKANEIARDIGGQQVRAYVHIGNSVVKLWGNVLLVEIILQNTGQSPAYAVRVKIAPIIWIIGRTPSPFAGVHEQIMFDEQFVDGGVIGAGISPMKSYVSVKKGDHIELLRTATISENNQYFSVMMFTQFSLTWRDVFGRNQEIIGSITTNSFDFGTVLDGNGLVSSETNIINMGTAEEWLSERQRIKKMAEDQSRSEA